MKIYLFLSEEIKVYKLPNVISGSFSFDPDVDEDIKLINIESRNGKWVLYSTSNVNVFFDNSVVDNIVINVNTYYILQRSNKNYLIFIDNYFSNNLITYSYDKNINISVGKNNSCNFFYDCPFISGSVYKLLYREDKLVLEHKNNNPLYINNRIMREIEYNVSYGDIINVYGFRLVVFNKFLIFNKLDFLNIILKSTGLFDFSFPSDNYKDIEIIDRNLYEKGNYFSKAPRIRRMIEEKEIEFSAPPLSNTLSTTPMFITLGPMFLMGITSAVTFFDLIERLFVGKATIESSWTQILTSGVMLTSTVLWPVITNKYQKYKNERDNKNKVDKYIEYLIDKEEEFKEEVNLQKSILIENLITLQDCLNIIDNKTMNFWDKRLDQNDIMTVRIGIGNELLKIKIDYPKEGFTTDDNELRKLADQLVYKYKYINNVPISFSFFENYVTAIMGNIYKCYGLIDNILLQLLTFYSYEDLKIVVFTSDEKKKRWNYVKYLNHNFSNNREIRFFACNNDEYKTIANYLYNDLYNRFNSNNNNSSSSMPDFKPYYFIITDVYDLIKDFNFVSLISESDKNVDASFIIIEERLSKLPSRCNNFINMGESTSGILRNSYESQEQLVFNDEINYKIDMMEVAKKISNIPIEFENGSISLPTSLSFMELEKIGKVGQLNILNRWNTNDPITSLKTEIGIDEQGQVFYLDLHEKAFGPHGLIAGMTGSGKSEFIITYILSMCVNYSPNDVSFILIDYKGGGLAGAFENQVTGVRLPHLAGVITNLDKSEMDRTLVSINSEAKRRQAEFNKARDILGESTIDIYKYQKFYKEGRLQEPISHLFIICDEFAELKAQQPDFMDNLISIARIGRSLGIHLILATQKPSGVVNDQIWSNAKFHVCLKVQDASDSKEMIKRPDAAELKDAGRFYLQVGYDEYFAIGQSAWCGAKYYPNDTVVKEVDRSVNLIDNCGHVLKSLQAGKRVNVDADGEQITAVLNEIIKISKETHMESKRLWLPNIPDVILVDNLIKKYNVDFNSSIISIIGEVDIPENQKQDILTYDLVNDGNCAIIGTDGLENEMILNSIVYSLVSHYNASQVNLYAFDFGTSNFRKYNKFPQFGGVVLTGEDEKYRNLFKLISDQINIRKKIVSDSGLSYGEYIKQNVGKMPLIVIFVNQYDSMNDYDDNLYDNFSSYIRDSEQYGVIFVITASSVNSLSRRSFQSIGRTFALKLNDSFDYPLLFNTRGSIAPRSIFGRGICFIDSMLEFQTSSVVDNPNNLNKFILDLSEKISVNSNTKAKKIPVLPDQLTEDMITEEFGLYNMIIGMNRDDLEFNKFNFCDSLCNLVLSNKISYGLFFIKSLIIQFSKINNTKLYIFDVSKLLGDLNIDYLYNNDIENKLNELNKFVFSKPSENILVIFVSFSKLIDKLSDKSIIDTFLNNMNKLENKSIIIYDDVNKFKSFVFETWYTSNINSSEGIWIGAGLGDQSVLKISNYSNELTKDFDKNIGFHIHDGIYDVIKLLEFERKDEDE